MKRLICAVIGHHHRPVTAITLPDGTRRFTGHPEGERDGCRRCRRVLPNTTRKRNR